MGYFSDTFLLPGAAPHYATWKSAFTDKLIARYPYSLRDSNNVLRVNHNAQWVKITTSTDGTNLNVRTSYSSALTVLGFLFFFIGLIVLLTSWLPGGLWFFPFFFTAWLMPGGVVLLIIGFCCFGVNEEMNIHKAVSFMARKAWEEVNAKISISVTLAPSPTFAAPVTNPIDAAPVPRPASSPARATETPAQFCAFCGAKRTAGAQFCEQCGAELS